MEPLATDEEILRKRAKQLAAPNEDESAQEQGLEVLVFILGAERYAVEVGHIYEACAKKEITPIPGVPAFVAGVINLRGRIISVVDLRRLFGLPVGSAVESSHEKGGMVVLSCPEMFFALLVDRVEGMTYYDRDQIGPLLPTFSGLRETLVFGVGKDHTIFLDGEKLLSAPELVVDQSE